MMFCSIIAQNFLPHARVLAESLAEHHHDCAFDVLVVDAPEEPGEAGELFRRVSLSMLGLPRAELNRRLTLYETAALASSLRGPLLAACLARMSDAVLYLDADMLVLGPLTDIGPLALRHGVVLTPHSTVPLRFTPGGFGPEQAFLQAGVFNGGFLAVSLAAADFLRWRDERVARDCVVAVDRSIVLGQAWLSLVPALFDHHVLRDRGINLMGHGMGEDDLTWRGDKPWIGETPVRLFHFGGGFDPHVGGLSGHVTSQHWWPRASERPGLARLCAIYGERLLAAGFDRRMAAGEQWLDPSMRTAYRKALIGAEENKSREPPNPFSDGKAAFAQWLASPAWTGSRVSHYVAAMHATRADLRAMFPRVPGADEKALLNWVVGNDGGQLPVRHEPSAWTKFWQRQARSVRKRLRPTP